jgi:hypothetical protein
VITNRALLRPLEVRERDHAIAMTVPCRTCGATVGQLCVRGWRTMKHHIHGARRVALWSTYTRRYQKLSTTTAEPSRSYRIEVEYCNLVTRDHTLTSLTDAVGEYALMMAAALEPTRLAPAAKHVRQVTMVKLDGEDVIDTITTPQFACEHLAVGIEV